MATQIENASQASNKHIPHSLPILNSATPHTFIKPTKKINEGQDVDHFLTSKAYSDIGLFVMQLNIAMCPRKDGSTGTPRTWMIDSPIELSQPVERIKELLQKVEAIIEEAPPDTGPRRFGNVSFRKWYEIVESRTKDLLQTYLPVEVTNYSTSDAGAASALDELTSYFLGGFGSSQRLDYGTGHELSFLAFLGSVWKLGGFTKEFKPGGALERSIVIGIIER